MRERIRQHEEYIAYLISQSATADLDTLLDAEGINCYAAARLLTHQDFYRQYYAPGRIYNLKYGTGKFVQHELSAEFINECIMRDNLALNQPCTRVNFSDIDPNDGYHYFGLCKMKLFGTVSVASLNKILTQNQQWHFIFRLPTGNWLHKPGYEQPIDIIEWEEYGNRFKFDGHMSLQLPQAGSLHKSDFKVIEKLFEFDETGKSNFLIPVEATCFENYFYRMDNKYELIIPKDCM